MNDRPSPVLFNVDPLGVATITLNRPERGNAYDDRMLEAFNSGLDTLAKNGAVRILVLRGAGTHFQAGADIDWLSQAGLLDTRGAFTVANAIGLSMTRLHEFPQPSVAVVQGACYSGGCGFACCTDVVLCAADAVFALGEVRAGVTPPPISAHLINAIGGRHARRFATTGERFGAVEALRIGLVHDVVESGRLEPRLAAVREAIMQMPGAAILAPDLRKLAKLGLESWSRRSTRGAGGAPSFQERRRPGWLLSAEPEES